MIRSFYEIVIICLYFSKMIFEYIAPPPELSSIVKEFWIYENDNSKPEVQKIIPDGYSEIIIHYGDPYEINSNGRWVTQSSMLYSNQISSFFYLRNTGKSAIVAIKLHPAAFSELFDMDVSQFTDQVISLDSILSKEDLDLLASAKEADLNIQQRVDLLQQWLLKKEAKTVHQKVRLAVDQIIEQKGMVDIEGLAKMMELSTRQLERNFKKVIGVTPKFYSRIIRFNYIFEIMKENNASWVKTALQSGYFDQSHFINNFKEFTGEEPSQYGFDETNLANFFLKR
jgi:methylphosphotriester-DNA--protein-cysteine methyltransferase